jgi:hypothetical protein
MKLTHWLILIGLALFLLALAGWIAEGVRWTVAGARLQRRPAWSG